MGQFGFTAQGADVHHQVYEYSFEENCHEGLEENGIYFLLSINLEKGSLSGILEYGR